MSDRSLASMLDPDICFLLNSSLYLSLSHSHSLFFIHRKEWMESVRVGDKTNGTHTQDNQVGGKLHGSLHTNT